MRRINGYVSEDKYLAFNLISGNMSWSDLINEAVTEFITVRKKELREALSRKIYPHPIYENFGADKFGNCYELPRNLLKLINLSSGYKAIRIEKERVFAHRFIHECVAKQEISKDKIVDHINRIKSDNRFQNLQVLTNKEHALKHSVCDTKHAKYKPLLDLWQAKVFGENIGYFYKKEDCLTLVDSICEKRTGIRPNKTKPKKIKALTKDEYLTRYKEKLGYIPKIDLSVFDKPLDI